MPAAVINPRIRGFICTTAHPAGCAAEVRRLIERARARAPGHGLGTALVVGASTGYGLASLASAVFGYGADAIAVCLERAPAGDKPGSAGFYNLAELQRLARAAGRRVAAINADAFAHATRAAVIERLRAWGRRLDLIVYSLASPRRKDPDSDTVWSSVLKPLGQPYTAKTIDLDSDQVKEITIAPASEAEREATVKVMGGEDWQLWIAALEQAGLLAEGCRSVAYSYIGPAITHPIYRAGTIGAAKDHLEATARALHQRLAARGGGAWVSVNKALVTQASSAIPVVPLYISLLFAVMKARGTHEDTGEQIARLFADHLAPGRTPALDEAGRIRIDDLELDPAVQAEVARRWQLIDSANLRELSDYDGFKAAFRRLFGFEVPGIDYQAPVEVAAALE